MTSRGFKKSEDKWLSKEDYERRQKGLYTFIEYGIEKKGTLDEVLDGLSPSRFEEFVSLLFRSIGYEAKNLPHVGDYGVDILVERNDKKTVVQVKKWKGNVGAPTVQKTLGSMWKYNAHKAILITTGDFTKNAYKQAEGAPIELWDRNKLKDKLEQHLPSYLVSQKPISIHLLPILENACISIKSKVISRANPQTAMRLEFVVKKDREGLTVHINGPLDYFQILETVIKEHLTLAPFQIQNFLNIMLKKEKLTELQSLQKSWNDMYQKFYLNLE